MKLPLYLKLKHALDISLDRGEISEDGFMETLSELRGETKPPQLGSLQPQRDYEFVVVEVDSNLEFAKVLAAEHVIMESREEIEICGVEYLNSSGSNSAYLVAWRII